LQEKIQVDAIQFIANNKGRKDVESAVKKLYLQPLEQRRRNRHINLLMEILAKEEQHQALSSAYDELLNKPTDSTIQTRSRARGQSQSVGANTIKYLNSFFPKEYPEPKNWSQPKQQFRDLYIEKISPSL